MYVVTVSVHVSTVKVHRPTIIWLEAMFTAYWFRFLLTVRHLTAFHLKRFLPSSSVLFYVWTLEYRSVQYLHHFRCRVGVQNTGVRICWENRLWSSAATDSEGIILKNTSSCILIRRASRTPKLMKVAHICQSTAIWLTIMTVQCNWYEESRPYVDPVSYTHLTLPTRRTV